MPKASILFHSEKIAFDLSNPKKTALWLCKICDKEQRQLGSLTYIFCTDKFLGNLNREYLKHSTLTDIITFDYSEGSSIDGEIYISIPRVRENARKYKEPFEKELRRVMVHGLLHLLGYNDKKAFEKSQMRGKEEACLSLWK